MGQGDAAKIIRNHFRMTTQPFDGPPQAEEAAKAIAHLNSEEMLLFFDRLSA